MFERYQRSEQALMLAMMEMVINGVSTRKIEQVTEELCGRSFSKSMVSDLCRKLDPLVEAFRTRPLKGRYPFVIVDAIYLKVREDGRVRSKGLLIAMGVNGEGYREVLGFKLADSETESSWGEFFSELRERGLTSITYNIFRTIRIKGKQQSPKGCKVLSATTKPTPETEAAAYERYHRKYEQVTGSSKNNQH